ncbi:MAG: hypothetical protein ACOYMN_13720 [Roseimicrobium sp.]
MPQLGGQGTAQLSVLRRYRLRNGAQRRQMCRWIGRAERVIGDHRKALPEECFQLFKGVHVGAKWAELTFYDLRENLLGVCKHKRGGSIFLEADVRSDSREKVFKIGEVSLVEYANEF